MKVKKYIYYSYHSICIFIKKIRTPSTFDLHQKIISNDPLPKISSLLFSAGTNQLWVPSSSTVGLGHPLGTGRNRRFRVGKTKTGMPQLKRVPPSHHLNQNVTRQRIEGCHTDKNRGVFTALYHRYKISKWRIQMHIEHNTWQQGR